MGEALSPYRPCRCLQPTGPDTLRGSSLRREEGEDQDTQAARKLHRQGRGSSSCFRLSKVFPTRRSKREARSSPARRSWSREPQTQGGTAIRRSTALRRPANHACYPIRTDAPSCRPRRGGCFDWDLELRRIADCAMPRGRLHFGGPTSTIKNPQIESHIYFGYTIVTGSGNGIRVIFPHFANPGEGIVTAYPDSLSSSRQRSPPLELPKFVRLQILLRHPQDVVARDGANLIAVRIPAGSDRP